MADPFGIAASVITILGAVAAAYKTIEKISDLPSAFDVVKNDLPIVNKILAAAEKGRDNSNLSEDDKNTAVSLLEPCKGQAKELGRIFEELESKCKKHPDTRTWNKAYKWYLKALKGTKAHKVERLMKSILENVKNLAMHQIFVGLATKDDMQKINDMIKELSEIEPSVEDSELEISGIHASQDGTKGNPQQNFYYTSSGGTNTFNSGTTFHAKISNLSFGITNLHYEAPGAIIPFRRNQDFIVRGNFLQRIEQLCSQPAGQAALVGISGIGKTQLAIEYAHRVKSSNAGQNENRVFWIYASDLDRAKEGFLAIADTVNIPGRSDPTCDIFQLVHDWLKNETKRRWLLVLDNADDDTALKVWSHVHRLHLADYIPRTPNGSLLVITRDKSVAKRFVDNSSIIEVGPMSREDALALFRRKAGTDDEDTTIAELVEALGLLPLAISHAATYIVRNQISVRDYLEILKVNDLQKESASLDDRGDEEQGYGRGNSLGETRTKSVEHLRAKSPSAADLLFVMSLFAPEDIPKSLLLGHTEHNVDEHGHTNRGGDGGNSKTTSEELEADLSTLLEYSMISVNQTGDEVNMHRHLRHSVQEFLSSRRGEIERFQHDCLRWMGKAWPIKQSPWNDQVKALKLYPHAKVALSYEPGTGELLSTWVNLIQNVGNFAVGLGRYHEAEELIRRGLDQASRILGINHNVTRGLQDLLQLIDQRRHRSDFNPEALTNSGDGFSRARSKIFSLQSTQEQASHTSWTSWQEKEVGEEEEVEGEEELEECREDLPDDATLISDAHSLANPMIEKYISQFAQDLSDAFSQIIGAAGLEKLEPMLPELLKEFAARIVLDSSTQKSKDIMYITYKYHESIIKEVCQNFPDASDKEEEDIEEDERIRQDDVMPLIDKISLLLGKQESGSQEEAHEPVHEDSSEDDNGDEDDAEDLEPPDILTYRNIITTSAAYQWLLSRIRGEEELEMPEEDVRGAIRRTILQNIGRPKNISRRKPPQATHTITFQAEWDPFKFRRQQQYKESLDIVLEGAVTITGWGNNVQAATCLQYMTQTWPTTGPSFLRLLQEMAKDPANKHTDTLPNKATVTVSYAYADKRVTVVVSGSVYCIAEVGEQVAWLGSALRSSPLDQGIVCCQPSLMGFRRDAANHPASQVTGEYKVEFKILTSKDDKNSAVAADCWHNLFRNHVVVAGYPILRRSKRDSGLDIPLDIMAPLINSNTLVDFNGRTFVKGFSAMLAATEVVGGFVFWHLFFNKNGAHISYGDPRVPPVSKQTTIVDIGHLETGRHILGWCRDVKNYVGAPDANYNIGKARLEDPNQSCAFQNVSISGGKYLTVSSSAIFGIKDKPLHIQFSPEDPIGTLDMLSHKQFVFYDVKDERAWLVDGTSALLHLLRASMHYYQKNRNYNKLLLFDATKIQEAQETHTGNRAAFEFLSNKANLAIPLYSRLPEVYTEKKRSLESVEVNETQTEKSTEFCVKDRVEQIAKYLEQIIVLQENAHTQTGVSFRPKLTPRKLLQGFHFMDVAIGRATIWPKMATLSESGHGWVDFTRAIHAVTLFGTGFGDLLQPRPTDEACITCMWHINVPKSRNYLAVCNAELQSIFDTEGMTEITSPLRLVKNIYWHTPDKAFEACTCSSSLRAKQHDRVQVLLSTSLSNLFTKAKSPAALPENGAVLFGPRRSRKFPLREEEGGREPGGPESVDSSRGGDQEDWTFQDSGLGTSTGSFTPGYDRSPNPFSPEISRSNNTFVQPRTGVYMQRSDSGILLNGGLESDTNPVCGDVSLEEEDEDEGQFFDAVEDL